MADNESNVNRFNDLFSEDVSRPQSYSEVLKSINTNLENISQTLVQDYRGGTGDYRNLGRDNRRQLNEISNDLAFQLSEDFETAFEHALQSRKVQREFQNSISDITKTIDDELQDISTAFISRITAETTRIFSEIDFSVINREFEREYKNWRKSAIDSLNDSIKSDNNQRVKFSTRDFKSSKGNGSFVDQFLDGFEKGIYDAIGASEIQDRFRQSLDSVADALGVSVEDLPNKLGESLVDRMKQGFDASLANGNTNAQQAKKWVDSIKEQQDRWLEQSTEDFKRYLAGEEVDFSWTQQAGQDFKEAFSNFIPDNWKEKFKDFSDSPIGSTLSDNADKFRDSAKDRVSTITDFASSKLEGTKAAEIGTKIANKTGDVLTKLAPKALSSGASAGLELALGAAGGPAGIVAMLGIEAITDFLGQLTEGFGKFIEGLSKAANRDMSKRQKLIELSINRVRADTEELIKEPFQVLKDAANEMYQAWDGSIRVINQTQGYSKEDLQDLISAYAQRLRDEGLGDTVSSAEITSNLKKVLESGLSGEVAEQFAYLATKLNAAVPTQDFFAYGDAYASLAANAIKDGRSQGEAIQYANQQLELFASNVLYASRQISGGFSTGLQNASDIFKKATQIAVASRIGDPSQIAGTLTSVAAITGAIAPDLASSIVDAVYNAAVGGNNSQIVALRSLAGINASNTEFLQSFVNNPKEVFATLFRNLGSMQNMSQANYMEVAEGLADTFGLSSDAFARVDFNYLADAVSAMNVSNAALTESMTQLESGQSTLTSEQMRIRQINEYMINQGLSYVLDNAAARSIQEHMWDEQLAQQIQDNTYRIDLVGDALQLLQDIIGAVRNILGFLNPVTTVLKAINLAQTIYEAAKVPQEIENVLKAGQIGKGNQQVLKNLTNVGKELNLTNSYLSTLQDIKSKEGGVTYTWGVVGKSLVKYMGSVARGSQAQTLYKPTTPEEVNLGKLQDVFNANQAKMSDFFGSTVSKQMNSEIDEEVQKRVNAINLDNKKYKSRIDALTKQYAQADEATLSGMNSEAAKAAAREAIQKQARERALAEIRASEINSIKQEVKNTIQNKFTEQANDAEHPQGLTGYEAWKYYASHRKKPGDTTKEYFAEFDDAIKELGYSDSEIRNYFDELENQSSGFDELARKEAESTFWQRVQELLDLLNTNVHDVFDKTDVMGIFWPGVATWLEEIARVRLHDEIYKDALKEDIAETRLHKEIYEDALKNKIWRELKMFRLDWENYYIKHATYTYRSNEGFYTSSGTNMKNYENSPLFKYYEGMTNQDYRLDLHNVDKMMIANVTLNKKWKQMLDYSSWREDQMMRQVNPLKMTREAWTDVIAEAIAHGAANDIADPVVQQNMLLAKIYNDALKGKILQEIRLFRTDWINYNIKHATYTWRSNAGNYNKKLKEFYEQQGKDAVIEDYRDRKDYENINTTRVWLNNRWSTLNDYDAWRAARAEKNIYRRASGKHPFLEDEVGWSDQISEVLSHNVNADISDPTVQTNMLLAKIYTDGLKNKIWWELKRFRINWEDYYLKNRYFLQNMGLASAYHENPADVYVNGQKQVGTATMMLKDKFIAFKDLQDDKKMATDEKITSLLDLLLHNTDIADLLDPTVQQNVFLASILQAVQTIVQQNNTQGKLKLPDALSALATGYTEVSAVDSSAKTSK